jgi:hypothetical protein
MSERGQWISVAVVVVVVLAAVWTVSAATKPECPTSSTPKWTRSGWYCVVPSVK